MNRVPWASNNTTLPTALAARSTTLSSADTITRPFQISQGTIMIKALFTNGQGLE